MRITHDFLFFFSIEVCGYRKRSDAKNRVTKKKERKKKIDREREVWNMLLNS